MKMRAAVLYEQGKPRPYADSTPLVIETVDLAGPQEGEVLVQVKGAGLCHSDLSTIDASRPRKLPTIPGHEGAGVVVEVGPGVRDFAPDDHVVFVFSPSCGKCRQCTRGRPNVCSGFQASRASGELYGGGSRLKLGDTVICHYGGVSCFAEYAVVDARSIVRIDTDVPLVDAAMFGCAVQTGVGAAVNTAGVRPGDVIAVLGLGGVGLSCMMGAIVAGAQRVIAIDLSDEKLALARQLGATDTYSAKDPGCADAVLAATDGGVDYAFEMAGSVKAMELAYKITVRGGETITAGLPPVDGQFSIPQYQLVQDERSVRGSYMGSCVAARDIPRFLQLYKDRKLPIDQLKSGTIGLDDINAGFDRLADAEVVRQILTFD